MNKINLDLYADPIGDLYIEWKIPTQIISNLTINIGIPTYKYEMSYFWGMPVPLSSLAESIDCEIFQVILTENKDEKINYSIKKEFRGHSFLVINLNEKILSSKDILCIQYIAKKLVTKDKIFFNFVYRITSPLTIDILTDIKVTTRFSYDVNSYKLKTQYINKDTGRIEFDTEQIKHYRVGDYIYGYGENIYLQNKGKLDLHVHGSRLPFMIDRRLFWIFIFLWTLLGVSGLIGFFKFK